MNIFSIIVTYNGIRWYDRCFSSLRRSTIKVVPLVIDNASTDGSVDYIREHFPEVIILEQTENLGFAKANNVGMRYALDHGADYVFLLNQDAWLVQDNCLTNMISLAEEHKEYAILSPMQLYGNGNAIVAETKRYAINNESEDWISDAYFNRLKDLYEVQYVCAASWLISANTLRIIGGFDPLFYHYGEDDNYIQRVHYHGMKVGICPQVNVCHDCTGRPVGYNLKTLDWRKYILIKYCDINFNVDIDALLMSKFRVIFFQFVRFNRKLLRISVPEYLYIKGIKEKIKYSRTQNFIKGENWL